ncbi:MAG: DUF1553 domain-containing protein [Lentisphaerales bacterium]|nr:DUF1553 domain-containing protein [Lentisphaerales bacterium]
MKCVLFFLLLHFNLGAAEKKICFNEQVRPILSEKCYFCHGPDAEDIKGKLQLHTFEHATQERTYKTKSGKVKTRVPAIIPGKPLESLIWKRMVTEDEDDIMPPPERHMKVTKKELEIIKKWIEQGADYETLWSFNPLPKKVDVPVVKNATIKNEVDNYIQKALHKEGLKSAADASEDLLLRRLYLSLTGLVPTLEQIAEFKADKSGKAYENTVDKLLKSQAAAEHLTVDWMDVARYADSYGYQVDRGRNVWPYRDWVLKAFNKNLPYDQFIKHQLAGDLMPNADDDMRLATAFNRMHMQKNEGGSVPEEFRVEYVADRAQTAATAFLGITMECSRCHDHKYDPISQEDYFKTFALFNNINEAGLYSFFTSAVPSPSMPIMNDKEKATLATKLQAQKAAKMKLASVAEQENEAFKNWQKTWNGQISLKGLQGDFDFETVDKNKIKNKITGKADLTFNTQYSKSTEGQTGKGFVVDGDSSLDFADEIPMEKHRDFTLSIWANPAEEFKRSNIISRGKGWYDAGSRGYELMIEDGKLTFAVVHFYPGNEIRIRTQQKLAVNQWQHITVTYDGSSKAKGIKLFLNGQPLATDVISDNLTKEIYYSKHNPKKKKNSSNKIRIGARFRDNGFKHSKVDGFRKFDRQLTALEVRENFQTGTKPKSDQELFEYYLANHSEKHATAYKNLQTKRAEYNEYMRSRFHMMIMEELPERRKTYVLKRGLYSEPDLDREVEPGPPEKIYPFGPEYSRDRLGFAQWLTHPEHPLTARVTVNRYWQMIFGQGLVTTTNDFGMQGEFPSHPELLDYLSRYFIDSGWDLKALLKKMVMSHTFRQDSNMTAELNEKDPDNKLLARGPSIYMTAEMLRDNALFGGDLLSTQFGGGSAQPYNPSRNKYRRSLYTHWKRNDPSAEMLIFGAARRQICSVKREKTSTPLQPLVLMNSPQMVEGSRALAVKVLADKSEDQTKLKKLYTMLTSTEVNADQLQLLTELLKDQRSYFAKEKATADKLIKIGKSKHKITEPQEVATWTVMANTIMNLDSFYMLR